MENLMREIGELQNDYRKLVNGKKLTKRAMCDLVIPFRNKYNLTKKWKSERIIEKEKKLFIRY